MISFKEKEEKLVKLMNQYTRKDIVIAFSGGVDSSLLLKIATQEAMKNKTKVYAYTIHTMLHPVAELSLTKKLAYDMGAEYNVICVDEIKEAGIENNPINRCYLCKKCMFSKLKMEANSKGIEIVIEGTNLDDTKVYRPGIKALEELNIESPLLVAGFTKEDVRKLAALHQIAVSNKPSNPCLATRFPYNTKLDREEMKKVDAIEEKIKGLGFYNVRARIHGCLVRIEVDEKDLVSLLQRKEEIVSFSRKLGYDYISLDLEGFRSGSQDLHIR